MDRLSEVSAVILAGGKSRRMGMDKALLQYQRQSLLLRAIEFLTGLFPEVLVASCDPRRYPDLPVPCVPDELPGEGALVGIHAGLKAAKNQVVFVMACDHPFPQAELVRHLVQVAPDADLTIPSTARGFEPLFAVYGKTCLPFIALMVAEGERRIRLLMDLVNARQINENELRRFDPELASFININTPDDLKAHTSL